MMSLDSNDIIFALSFCIVTLLLRGYVFFSL